MKITVATTLRATVAKVWQAYTTFADIGQGNAAARLAR